MARLLLSVLLRLAVPSALAALLVLMLPSSASAMGSPREVEVRLRGSSSEVAGLRGAIEDLVGALGVQLRIAETATIDPREIVTPGPSDPGVLARIWADVEPNRVTLYLVDGPWERILVRHVPAPSGFDEVVREQVGQILAASVEALETGARIGIARDEASKMLGIDASPTPASAAPVAVVSGPHGWVRPVLVRPEVRIDAGWRMQVWSRPAPVLHGPTLSVGLAEARARVRPGGEILAQYQLPVVVREDDIELRLDTGALRGFATLEPRLGRRFSLRGRLGVGLDVVRVDADARGASVTTNRRFWDAIPIASAGVGMGVHLRAGLRLGIDLVSEVDLVDTRFVLWRSGAVVFDPWRVRPGIAVTVGWGSAP